METDVDSLGGDDWVVAVTSTPFGVTRDASAVGAVSTLNGFRVGVVIFIFSGGGGGSNPDTREELETGCKYGVRTCSFSWRVVMAGDL